MKEREIIRAAGPTVHPHTLASRQARSMATPMAEPNMYRYDEFDAKFRC